MKNFQSKGVLTGITALLLGMCMTLAFAPFEVFPLAIAPPVGLMALISCTNFNRSAFLYGFLFGVGFFGTGVYWIFNSIHFIGGVPTPIALFMTALLVSFMALFPGIVCYIARRYFPLNHSFNIIAAFPSLWFFSEWLRGFLFTGFPWLFIGYSQTNSPLKNYAAVLGVFGISFICMLTSALIFNCIVKLQQKKFGELYGSLFAVICLWLGGNLLGFVHWTIPQGKPIPVSLVQGNIPQTIKWSPEHVELSLNRYAELTENLWQKNRLIFWPEAAIPLPQHVATDYLAMLDARARASGAKLVLGIPLANEKNNAYYNAIITLGADSLKDTTVYKKRHLVPYGEYAPFAELFATAFNFMDIPLPNTVSGPIDANLLIIDNIKMVASICYEIAYPLLINSNDETIGFILTLTNDGWFGKSIAQSQHLQIAKMRSLEMQRPMLFVSNDGITAILNYDGKIEAALPPFSIGVLNGTIHPRIGVTPWMLFGIDPMLLLGVGFLIAVRHQQKRAKLKLQESQEYHSHQT